VDNPVSGLNAGKERLRQMLQNMPVMLNAFDHDEVCVAWNREYEIVTGYAVSERVVRLHGRRCVARY
jgi:PAS domain S-box-containing protein